LTLCNIAGKATHECLEEERLLPLKRNGFCRHVGLPTGRRKRRRKRSGGGGGGREVVKLVKLVQRLVLTSERCWVRIPVQ
jgi:hypothetical protein